MKVIIKHINSDVPKENYDFFNDFIKYLQKIKPLRNDVTIKFLGERKGNMTTGVRYPGSKIQVLSTGRLPIDVLRTLSHEWIHEFQTQKLGVDDSKPIQDIGGPEENMCNILSGVFVKQFEKDHPEFGDLLYGE